MRWLEIAVGADLAAIVATAVLFEPTATLVIPAAAALLPIVFRGRTVAYRARVGATVVLAAYALLGLMTAGLLFVPAAVFMGMAASRADSTGLGGSRV
jgi:hypothetical protein